MVFLISGMLLLSGVHDRSIMQSLFSCFIPLCLPDWNRISHLWVLDTVVNYLISTLWQILSPEFPSSCSIALSHDQLHIEGCRKGSAWTLWLLEVCAYVLATNANVAPFSYHCSANNTHRQVFAAPQIPYRVSCSTNTTSPLFLCLLIPQNQETRLGNDWND